MTRPYALLLAGILLAALALVAIGKAPRPQAPRAEPPTALPSIPLSLEIRDGAVGSPTSRVPKGRRVALTVVNRGAGPSTLSLTGYEDRVRLGPIAPGATAAIEFQADRPGEDFAWRVDGAPAGRFAVVGPHLEEGRE